MGPKPKPAEKAMNGLLKKSLISVAEAVSTILTPEPVSYLSFILNANREKECSTVLLKITASYTATHIDLKSARKEKPH